MDHSDARRTRADVIAARQQPHAPPQQPPPCRLDAGAGRSRPAKATVDSSFTVSACPAGHSAGALASRIGRLTSKVSPQLRQRNWYTGMG
jgi:hypothetical protein